MHSHTPCEGIVEGHPLVAIGVRLLRQQKLPQECLDYLAPRLFFAYPRTIWVKLNCTEAGPLPVPNVIGEDALNRSFIVLLTQSSPFRRVVLDLRGNGVPGSPVPAQLAEAAWIKDAARVFLIAAESDTPRIPLHLRTNLFHTEKELIKRLQHESLVRIDRIPLPQQLTISSLDRALKDHATPNRLAATDVVSWDFAATKDIDSEALTMLSPVIHSLAHSAGVMAAVENPSAHVRRQIRGFGALRVVQSYFAIKQEILFTGADENENGTSLKAYTLDEAYQIQDLYWDRFEAIVRNHPSWFIGKTKIYESSTWMVENKRVGELANLIKDLRQIVKELVENVLHHAHGLGYIAMELDPRPSGGLFIYVGDTGIGLARGVSRAYKMNVRSDAKAVSMFLQLVEKQKERRHLAGTLDSGGRGIARVSVILGKLEGKITVSSGSARAVFAPSKSTKPTSISSRMFPIQGTHIHIFIPPGSATNE